MISALTRTPLPIALLLIGLIQPSELSLYLGTMRLPPHRVVLLLFFGIAAIHMLMRRPIRLHAFDGLFFLYGVWTVLVFILHLGVKDGLEFGGSLALESFCAYFIARIYV